MVCIAAGIAAGKAFWLGGPIGIVGTTYRLGDRYGLFELQIECYHNLATIPLQDILMSRLNGL